MKYPALELLAQGYLTLEWPDDYPTACAAIDDFIAQEPAARKLPVELAQLLQATPDEDRVKSLEVV